jgi:hypothetical protein
VLLAALHSQNCGMKITAALRLALLAAATAIHVNRYMPCVRY